MKCYDGFVIRVRGTQYDKTFGMFGEEIPLNEYILANGKKVREVLQASSGPVIFLKLVDENGSDIYAWTDEEMERITLHERRM